MNTAEPQPLQIRNARITSTQLGNEDHGIPTSYVTIDAGGCGGGFGGHDLRYHGIGYVTTLLKALDVESWEKLPRQLVRAASSGIGSQWLALGHIIEDRWFVCDKDGPRILTEQQLRELHE